MSPAALLGTRIVVLDGDAEAPDLTWEEFTAGGETVPTARAGAVRDSISPQAPSDIILTSGTTGHPKGVITRHDQNVLALIRYIEHLGLVDGERAYVTLPFFHNFGLKAGFVAGSMLSVELVARIKNELGSEVFTGYGLSEIAGAVTLTPSGGAPERVTEWAGSVVEGVEVRIIDGSGRDVPHGTEGEILARSDCVMTGYLDDQPATAAAIDAGGWLHTGNIGALDGEGYIKILDRKKDMFIAGGFNVYPAEIEQLLLRHPAIKQVAVVGMPDGRLGEVGAAFVVLAPGESATPDELTGWARLNMSNFKVPRKVTIMDALPMNTSFKVLKGELRKLAAQGR
jgi:acyl-CoA synthetase (AMP-forming)/AMP-acid ligase II